MNSIPSLRRVLRSRRRSLSPREQREHSQLLARRLGSDLRILKARRIGVYWPNDGELDPWRLIRRLRGLRQRQVYLPVLRSFRSGSKTLALWFVPMDGQHLRPNHFGIPEPQSRQRWLAWHLDVLLVPLVGFDDACNRIGMGGGFYDRTLAYLNRRTWRRPRLIGVAHECQHVGQIEPRAWDVPLDAVCTERRCVWRPASSSFRKVP